MQPQVEQLHRDILTSMHNFMFCATLHASNGTVVQTFTTRHTFPVLLFHSNHHYLTAAFTITLLALLIMFFLFWGWWEFGQCVTLSPVEIAKAFVTM
jgi:hypothetical protein